MFENRCISKENSDQVLSLACVLQEMHSVIAVNFRFPSWTLTSSGEGNQEHKECKHQAHTWVCVVSLLLTSDDVIMLLRFVFACVLFLYQPDEACVHTSL